jgi:hypothetical protein
MTSKRLHLIMIAVLVLLFIGLVGGAYGINTLLASRADKLVTLKAKGQALAQEQLSLNQAKKDITTYAGLDKIAQSVVPQDKDQAEAIREIVNLAATNNVSLASITFPASSLGTGPVASSGTTAPPATASPGAAVNSKVGALSQLTAVKNIPGVYQLPITVVGDSNQPVQYNKFISFLSDLEHDRRTAQVSGITIQPDTKNTSLLTFSLTINEYIKP